MRVAASQGRAWIFLELIFLLFFIEITIYELIVEGAVQHELGSSASVGRRVGSLSVEEQFCLCGRLCADCCVVPDC